MQLKEQSSELCDRLNDELVSFSPGSRFYSVRQLMLRYRVSRRVIDAALAQLEQKGAIETRPQSGIYVKQNRLRKHVALLMPDWPSEGNKRIQQFLKEEFQKRADRYAFSTILYEYQENLVRKITQIPADVHIVVRPGDPLERRELAEYAALPSEVIFLWSDLADVSMHSLHADCEYGGMLAAAYFIRNGHQNLAVLPSEPRNGDIINRIAGYTGVARLFGARVTEIPCVVHPWDYSIRCAHDAICDYLAQHGCNFTALFMMSDESTQGALAAFAENGIRIPEEIFVPTSFQPVVAAEYFRSRRLHQTGKTFVFPEFPQLIFSAHSGSLYQARRLLRSVCFRRHGSCRPSFSSSCSRRNG